MTIAAILAHRDGTVHAAAPGDSVGKVSGLLADRRIGAVPVLENDVVVGIFSERDLVHCLAAYGTAALDRPMRDVMTSPVVGIDAATDVMAALSLMTRRRIRHLPVLDGTTLIGFVSIGDLVKHRIDRIEAEAEAMRSYIAGS